ncbi:hypothetical protein CRM22_005637 [Opisthorchis felineus]|uniref:Little elongation complex subunit 2 C-terminal domain-containing protein n=1 Tax=Opisthorchis felineus TaxID=147828 RepID=A0A4S2LQ74_OPIFE|nr:hypothetical protein CRM22_005637 [Opisthorchis felineus]
MFLDEVALSQLATTGLSLLDVQAAVFHHFEDLRRKFKEEEAAVDISSEGEDQENLDVETKECICFFKPKVFLTPKDINQYTHLLSTIGNLEGDLNKRTNAKQKKRKKNMAHNLEVAHAKVTQAQLLIQTQLLACHPCAHKCLPTASERLVYQSIVDQQENTVTAVPRHYRLLRHIVIQASTEKGTFVRGPQSPVKCTVLPPHDSFKLSSLDHFPKAADTEMNKRMVPQTIRTNLKGEVVISSSLITLLFEHSSLAGVYMPFTVKRSTLGSSVDHPTIEFHGPVWSRPLSPRMRTRMFYELSFQATCTADLPSLTDSTKVANLESIPSPSHVSSPAASVSTRTTRRSLRSKRTLHASVRENPTRSEDVIFSGISKAPMSVQQRSPAPLNPMTTRSRTIHAISVSSTDVTDDDTDDLGNLSIDIDSSDSNNKISVSELALQEIATSCTVVTRSCRRDVDITKAALDSAPASPTTTEAPASPDLPNKMADGSPGLCVIPLEPISSSVDNSGHRSPSAACSTPSSCYSWTTVQVGQIDVHVPVSNISWSSTSSCVACCKKAVGHCPLWPSCSSRMSAVLPGLIQEPQPVYVQVKPEYLGCWGCEVLSAEELAVAWLGSRLRGDADILRIRVRADSGDVVWAEYQSLHEFLSANPGIEPDVNMGFLHNLFDQLMSLSAGSYVLTQKELQPTGTFDLYEALSSLSDKPGKRRR